MENNPHTRKLPQQRHVTSKSMSGITFGVADITQHPRNTPVRGILSGGAAHPKLIRNKSATLKPMQTSMLRRCGNFGRSGTKNP
ncbi:hypothetical protein [Nitrosomonas sp.]|uniref:hypothetical protein n=1 Tax=Nitrosomonas sp. TaxID=42353 RepID=UPI0026161632|nr:hypothetical protein [Nitrosomonas sp.]MCW5601393.1 hypothetical protein [Nitrosomonas sp.]